MPDGPSYNGTLPQAVYKPGHMPPRNYSQSARKWHRTSSVWKPRNAYNACKPKHVCTISLSCKVCLCGNYMQKKAWSTSHGTETSKLLCVHAMETKSMNSSFSLGTTETLQPPWASTARQYVYACVYTYMYIYMYIPPFPNPPHRQSKHNKAIRLNKPYSEVLGGPCP